ncbi:LOW QUALITY PROTEIN: integral membrane protein GPR155-like [Pollicipes pollicipes]|uniref:LOW QUALITY PROTEIN: integral membrane protein GPR155-like n=1 Tax=Pollicipes pollicipes TaxID=41117 RepID=UPI001884BE04|nr:LOW QUALITY PROTEIN: integral membrane protein GPR155-like [Pollicipes pollicipes]
MFLLPLVQLVPAADGGVMALPLANGSAMPTAEPDGRAVMDELFPAVVQCFSVTLCGYLAGRFKIISSHEGRGIELFVGKFALPTLIFLSMATLDFTVVNWNFLFAILLAKAAVFGTVLLGTVLVTRPTDYSLGSLYAIFCTQSNDFALGYPIISAIYKDSHPEFVAYLYLVAPVSLCVLNPVGFALMELWKRRHLSLEHQSSVNGETRQPVSICRLVLLSLRGVLTNPIVVMTALGLLGNVIFQHIIPKVLYNILNTFAVSFSATALFMLGLHMVTRPGCRVRSDRYLVPFILIVVKSMVLPLVTREAMSLLQGPATHNANLTVDLTNYAFLYGILPTAPSVLVYATHYDTGIEVMANALVIGTFLSAPLMFVSAWMVSVYSTVAPSQYIHYIDSYICDISIIGLVCCVWVFGVFLLSGKFRRVPHFITTCLIVSQAVACVGAILSTQLDCSSGDWSFYLHFPLTVGVVSSRVWTALLAVALLLLRTRSLCFVLRCRLPFMAIGWAFPLVLTVVLLVSNGGHHMYEGDPSFQLGQFQSVTAIVILTISLTVTLFCLVVHHRYNHLYSQYTAQLPAGADSPPRVLSDTEPDSGSEAPAHDPVTVDDIEELVQDGQTSLSAPATCTGQRPCDPNTRQLCREIVRNYYSQEEAELGSPCEAEDQLQITKHVLVLLLLSLSMIVGLFLSVWNLVMDTMTGVYVVVDFLDGALNFGQGVFVFLLFGLDNELIVLPVVQWWRRLLWGSDAVHLPDMADLEPETRQTCNQFIDYHLEQCRRSLVKDRRHRLKLYRHVFTGQELVDWLMRRGLAPDRTEATKYGRRLVDGRVVRHLRQQHHFHDRHLFYQLRWRLPWSNP